MGEGKRLRADKVADAPTILLVYTFRNDEVQRFTEVVGGTPLLITEKPPTDTTYAVVRSGQARDEATRVDTGPPPPVIQQFASDVALKMGWKAASCIEHKLGDGPFQCFWQIQGCDP